MDKATLPQATARLEAWGNVDKMITATAAAVPLVWGQDDAHLVQGRQRRRQRVHDTIDFAYTSLK